MKCPLKPMPPDKMFNPKILKTGAKFEREHTDSDKAARQITKAHVIEFPKLDKKGRLTTDYYVHLKKMEKGLKKE